MLKELEVKNLNFLVSVSTSDLIFGFFCF
jgi:hypothetical protein